MYYILFLPQLSGDGDEELDEVDDLGWEAAGVVEVSLGDGAEDVIDGVISGDGAVEGDEVSFESLWDVVTTAAFIAVERTLY